MNIKFNRIGYAITITTGPSRTTPFIVSFESENGRSSVECYLQTPLRRTDYPVLRFISPNQLTFGEGEDKFDLNGLEVRTPEIADTLVHEQLMLEARWAAEKIAQKRRIESGEIPLDIRKSITNTFSGYEVFGASADVMRENGCARNVYGLGCRVVEGFEDGDIRKVLKNGEMMRAAQKKTGYGYALA